jgi:hypothetical protein
VIKTKPTTVIELLLQLEHDHPMRLERAHSYARAALTNACTRPDRFPNFLKWWRTTKSSSDDRALKLLGDLELAARLERDGVRDAGDDDGYDEVDQQPNKKWRAGKCM